MKTNHPALWISSLLLATWAVRADSLNYSNTVTLLPGNPPVRVGVNIPQFNPGLGNLEDIRLTLSGSLISTFSWNVPGGSGVTVFQTNAVTVIAGTSSVLAQKVSIFRSIDYPTPVTGYGQELWGSTLPQQGFVLTDNDLLQSFTGTGLAPVSAEWFNLAVITPFGTPGTWTLNHQGSVTVGLTYDFAAVPEPQPGWLLLVGCLTRVLLFARGCRSDALRERKVTSGLPG